MHTVPHKAKQLATVVRKMRDMSHGSVATRLRFVGSSVVTVAGICNSVSHAIAMLVAVANISGRQG